MNSILRKVLVFFLGLIFVMLVLEAGLRVSGLIMNSIYFARTTLSGGAPGYTVLCVGNCYTAGVGAPEGESYPENLQRILDKHYPGKNYKVVNRGRPGRNSAQILAALNRDILETDPDLVIVRAGSANFYNHVGLGNYLEENVLEPENFSGSLSLRGRIFLTRTGEFLYRARSIRFLYLLWVNLKEKIGDSRMLPGTRERMPYSWDTGEGPFYSLIVSARNDVDRGNMASAVKNYTEALKAAPSKIARQRVYYILMDLAEKIEDEDVKDMIQSYYVKGAPDTTQDSLYAWLRHDINKMTEIIKGYGLQLIIQDYPLLFPIDKYEGYKAAEQQLGEDAPIISVKADPAFKSVRANPPHRQFMMSVNSVLRDYSEDKGIPFVDNEEYFREEIEKGNVGYSGGTRYPNVFGYRFMAGKIYEKMLEEGFVKGGAGNE